MDTMLKRCFSFFLLSLLLVGCSVVSVNVTPSKTKKLTSLLQSLDPTTPKKQTLQLSQDILHKTSLLAQEFKLTSPPLFHNTLVNLGFREKGLCYHWSDALYLHLLNRYENFEFHLIGANIGEYFFEHNALVVLKKGGVIEEGVVIDPWRDSGEVYFTKVKDDRAYNWVHRANRGCLSEPLKR